MASLVLGIVSLVVPVYGILPGLVGFVLGLVALPGCFPRGPKGGRGMAIGGIVCSAIGLFVWGLVVWMLIAWSHFDAIGLGR